MQNNREEKMKVSFKFKENVSEEQEQEIWDSLFDLLLDDELVSEKEKHE